MKTIIKTFLIVLFIAIVIGFLFCVYVLNAPPIAQSKPPKLQVHTRTAIRGRPTTNSKPIVYTKSQYLFDIEKKYLSNLNIGVFSGEMLFSVALGQRAKYSHGLLDKELQDTFNWNKMFQDSLGGIEFRSKTPDVKVLLSGKDWILTDENGAGYTVQRNENELNIYLPNFEDVFNKNKISLSKDLDFSVIEKGKQWLLKDKKFLQTYEIKSDQKKLDILQQSKYPIATLLFKVNAASIDTLSQGSFTSDIYDGFQKKNIPLSKKAKLITTEDKMSWEVIDGRQKYAIRNKDGWLNVRLNLESDWLYVEITDRLKGWIPSKSGFIFYPPDPTLSSRQQLKIKVIGVMDRIKAAFGVFKKPVPPKNSELSNK